MRRVAKSALDLIETGYHAKSTAAIGRSFFQALQPYGARAIYARAYAGGQTAAEHVYCRISPPGWESFYADERFAEVNYLAREVARRVGPFAWSDVKLTDPAEIRLQQALIDNGFPDGLASPCHGPGGYIGVTSLAFSALDEISPDERTAIEVAALTLHNRMQASASHDPSPLLGLSRRERDCLAFLAEGYTDHEIAGRLGVADSTVITHVQNARRKLGARNRTQAVALAIAAGVLAPLATDPI